MPQLRITVLDSIFLANKVNLRFLHVKVSGNSLGRSFHFMREKAHREETCANSHNGFVVRFA